jgi:hypothetical protein
MLDVMCRELEALTTPPPPEQLERAKKMSVSLIHNALESKSASAEDIGRQFLTYGHRWVPIVSRGWIGGGGVVGDWGLGGLVVKYTLVQLCV